MGNRVVSCVKEREREPRAAAQAAAASQRSAATRCEIETRPTDAHRPKEGIAPHYQVASAIPTPPLNGHPRQKQKETRSNAKGASAMDSRARADPYVQYLFRRENRIFASLPQYSSMKALNPPGTRRKTRWKVCRCVVRALQPLCGWDLAPARARDFEPRGAISRRPTPRAQRPASTHTGPTSATPHTLLEQRRACDRTAAARQGTRAGPGTPGARARGAARPAAHCAPAVCGRPHALPQVCRRWSCAAPVCACRLLPSPPARFGRPPCALGPEAPPAPLSEPALASRRRW